jgi:serine/threonine protein phosphatase PrpC
MGLPPNALPSGSMPGSTGPSPRGGGGNGHHYGAASGHSTGGGFNMTGGGLNGGNSLFLGQQQAAQHQQQHSLQQQSGAAQGYGSQQGVPARRHRASSRQSSNKGSRRGHNRYAESPNYAPPHGENAGGTGSGKAAGHSAGPGYPAGAQQMAPSPNSTLLMSSGGADGSGHGQHHHGYGHHQQALPHIGGSGGPSGFGSAGNVLSALPPTGSKHAGSNPRSQYLSQVHSSPPSPTVPLAPSAASAAGAIPAFSQAPSPIVREFQAGNMLTGTEEHSHSGVTTIRGMKPGNPNWINQDNFFVNESFEGRDIRIYCVLDGHGEHGHLVSRRCREAFPQFIKSARLDIDAAFNMMQNDLNAASDMDVRCSGATCVMATLIGGRLAVYNCGDSRAVLGRRNPNGSIYAVALSKDHKPDKAEERKRILSCGGHLGCRQVLVNQPGRGPVSMPVGPCRVWYQHRGETLGLAMSRSLGDSIVHKSGVSAEPECMDRVIDDYDEFFILATDGVWDVVDNSYAVQMVQSFAAKSANWNPLEAAGSICRFARSRWEKLSPMIDDITCIVVKVHR